VGNSAQDRGAIALRNGSWPGGGSDAGGAGAGPPAEEAAVAERDPAHVPVGGDARRGATGGEQPRHGRARVVEHPRRGVGGETAERERRVDRTAVDPQVDRAERRAERDDWCLNS